MSAGLAHDVLEAVEAGAPGAVDRFAVVWLEEVKTLGLIHIQSNTTV